MNKWLWSLLCVTLLGAAACSDDDTEGDSGNPIPPALSTENLPDAGLKFLYSALTPHTFTMNVDAPWEITKTAGWFVVTPNKGEAGQNIQVTVTPALNQGEARDGEFMRQAREVYDVTRRLSDEQRLIASFWDCNPFYLNTQGHLNFATKKLSPGGHWISIAGQAAAAAGLDWNATSATYLITAVALFDGFISCWDEKYRSQLIRPETVINAHIDEKWRPLLQTPPFPEYTSGHSVISTAAAVVLTEYLGPEFAFIDKTEMEYGLPARTFTSFQEACNEAAISRLYGGIHYRAAIEQGQLQGERVGRWVLTKLQLKP